MIFLCEGGRTSSLRNLGDPNSDDWATPINPANGQGFGLSHLSFYDTTGGGKVAEPATLGLLGLGLLGLALARRRRQ